MDQPVSQSPITLTPDWPAPNHVKLLSTTRLGGYSQAPFDSFNLSSRTSDDKTSVDKNRAKLREHFCLPSEPLWLNQLHGNKVVSLDDPLIDSSSIINADASWSKQNNTVCAVLTADCLPVFMTDTKGSVVALAHAGWKGLLAGIITETVNVLGVEHQDILVWLGPAIGQQAFVVGDDVREAFSEKADFYLPAFNPEKAGFWQCDLYQLARFELAHSGVEQVYGGGLCTHTDVKRFYSYRRDGKNTGRQAHCIWLNQQ